MAEQHNLASFYRDDKDQNRKAACVQAALDVISAAAAGGNAQTGNMLQDIDIYASKIKASIESK